MLQSDGGNYCASINAATLALIDAGIPMKDIVCACSASFMKETSVVDINHMEENHAGVEVGRHNSTVGVTFSMWHTGAISRSISVPLLTAVAMETRNTRFRLVFD